MTELTKTTLLLSIVSMVIYVSLIYAVRKEKKSLGAYGLCVFLSALAIWEFYCFAKVEPNRNFGLGSLSVFFEYAALILPVLAVLLFLFRKHLEPRLKKPLTPYKPLSDFPTKLPSSTPYWLEWLGIFFYKVLVWFFSGVILGSLAALMQGFMPIWFIVVFIFGSIALGWFFALLFFSYADRKRSLILAHDEYGCRATPARLDAIHFDGVRMMETRDLMIIEVTVFSRFEAPYQTTVRQFMTAEDIDQLREGDIITFYEDTRDSGYGIVSPKFPAGTIRADFKTFKANKVYPERRKTGLWLLIGRNPNVLTRSVSFILISAIFSIGFLSPYIISGNVEWLLLKIKHFPQRLIFQDKGNFNPEEFKKAYDKAIEYIDDQRIESLLFYNAFTQVTVEQADNAGYLRSVTIRGNSVERNFISWTIDREDRLFTSASVRYHLLKKALDDAATDHKLEDIMYIGVRKGIRWETRDHRIPPDYKQNYVDIHIVFEGGHKSLDYNGETGERLPK